MRLTYEEKNTPAVSARFWQEASYKGHKIKLMQDESAESPDSWEDDAAFLVGYHRDFTVERDDIITKEDLQEYFGENKKIPQLKEYHIFGLEAYIHSGVVLALSHEGNFPDRQWDVSQLGAVLISKKEARSRKKAKELEQALIETWNQYLSGDIWGYIIEDKNGEVVGSCWGFYGIEDAEREALQAISG